MACVMDSFYDCVCGVFVKTLEKVCFRGSVPRWSPAKLISDLVRPIAGKASELDSSLVRVNFPMRRKAANASLKAAFMLRSSLDEEGVMRRKVSCLIVLLGGKTLARCVGLENCLTFLSSCSMPQLSHTK